MDKTGTKNRKQNINKALHEYTELIEKKIGKDLISVILFGSAARGKPNPDDLDILIVMKTPPNPLEQNLFFKDISTRILFKYKEAVSEIAISPEEFEDWMKTRFDLILGILTNYEILFDKNSFFENKIEVFENELKKEGAKYLPKNKCWYVPSIKLPRLI